MKHYITENNPMRPQFHAMAAHQAKHFSYAFDAGVATITLNRPERKNPLTFDSYAELRDLFRALELASDVKVVVLTGAGGNFCSGGDVHEIIGPLTQMTMPEMLEFTRMTGNLIKAMRLCPQPIIAAIDGICAGAGAMMALAADMRLGTPRAKTAFLFTRVGLAGADMGACALLPRLIGQGRASEHRCLLGCKGLKGALEVLCLHADGLRLRFGLQSLVQRHGPFLMQHGLGHTVRKRRATGQVFGHRLCGS